MLFNNSSQLLTINYCYKALLEEVKVSDFPRENWKHLSVFCCNKIGAQTPHYENVYVTNIYVEDGSNTITFWILLITDYRFGGQTISIRPVPRLKLQFVVQYGKK